MNADRTESITNEVFNGLYEMLCCIGCCPNGGINGTTLLNVNNKTLKLKTFAIY